MLPAHTKDTQSRMQTRKLESETDLHPQALFEFLQHSVPPKLPLLPCLYLLAASEWLPQPCQAQGAGIRPHLWFEAPVAAVV